MDSQEWNLECSLPYDELIQYLKEKYGIPPKPYFEIKVIKGKECVFQNKKSNIRISEGLNIHHDYEKEYPLLSEKDAIHFAPYEVQLPKNLTYCNVLEHLLIHYKIMIDKHNKEHNEITSDWDSYRKKQINEIQTCRKDNQSAHLLDNYLKQFSLPLDKYLDKKYNLSYITSFILVNGFHSIAVRLGNIYSDMHLNSSNKDYLLPIIDNANDFLSLIVNYMYFADSVYRGYRGVIGFPEGNTLTHIYDNNCAYSLLEYDDHNPFSYAVLNRNGKKVSIPLYKIGVCYNEPPELTIYTRFINGSLKSKHGNYIIALCPYSFLFEKFRYDIASNNKEIYLKMNLTDIFSNQY